MKENEKVCIILNAKFSYLLIVDGLQIPFNGAANSEYFEEHYKSLGYKVVRKIDF